MPPAPETFDNSIVGGLRLASAELRARAKIVRASDLREERRRCEGSLIEFMIRAWEEIEPGELDVNWHHEEIAAALEAITRGEMRSLIINQPPRTTKTLMCNVFWPAWIWAQSDIRPLSGPQVRFLCVSYGANLAEEIAVKMRRLVTGEWYQSLWGDRVKIREDQQNRANFANTAGGERMSNSIEGGLLGRGGDIQIVDDPHPSDRRREYPSAEGHARGHALAGHPRHRSAHQRQGAGHAAAAHR